MAQGTGSNTCWDQVQHCHRFQQNLIINSLLQQNSLGLQWNSHLNNDCWIKSLYKTQIFNLHRHFKEISLLPWRLYLVLVIMKVPRASAHKKTICEADSNHDFLQIQRQIITFLNR